MANGIGLILIKDAKGYDISELVIQIKWSGRKGASSRSIDVTLNDDETRAGVDATKGHQCIYSYNGKELFRGIILQTSRSQKKQLSFKAYDIGIYLANNKDTFTYSNKTASDIFIDICKRFGLPYDQVATTSYKIPELTKPKTTAFDAICDALSQEFNATGNRHYVGSQNGKMRLLKRKENIIQWVIESGQNLITYSDRVSTEKVKTRIKLLSDEGTVVASKTNTALEKAIGVMQDIDEPDETLNSAQLQALVSSMLAEKSAPEHTLKVDALGITDVVSGVGVYIIIPALGLSKTYYVDEDTHIFKDQYHKMTLTLNEFIETETPVSPTAGGATGRKVGDIITFSGGKQYISSVSSTPAGGTRKGGTAKITAVAAGAKHPYHIVGGAYNNLDGDCNVYGWVDAGTVS